MRHSGGCAEITFLALAVTAILALGIGANTAVFSVVDAVLLRPLPYQSSERLVRIEEESPKRLLNGIPAADYVFWRDRGDLFEKTIPFLRDFRDDDGGGRSLYQLTSVARTPCVLFSLLGAHAEAGASVAWRRTENSMR